MLGFVDSALEPFVKEIFGDATWNKLQPWVETPHVDTTTFDFIATKLLGTTGAQVQEAMGRYCVGLYTAQGYHRLLSALGSNVAEFLSNLNSLPLRVVPSSPLQSVSLQCHKVSNVSLELHCRSSRPGLWPLLSSIVRGLVQEHVGCDITVELLQARGLQEGADHEVFLIKYPMQECVESEAEEVPAVRALDMHPFHLLLDKDCRLLHAGKALRRLFPDICRGLPLGDLVTVSHPHVLDLSVEAFQLEAAAPFLLVMRQRPSLVLCGQMLLDPAQILTGAGQLVGPGQQALLFVGSPRCYNLEELQRNGLYLSDLPLHDASRDLLLLSEQLHVEAELRVRLEQSSLELRADKAGAEAMVERLTAMLNGLHSSPPGSVRHSAAACKGTRTAATSPSGSLASRPTSLDSVHYMDHTEGPRVAEKNSRQSSVPEPGLGLDDTITICESLSEGMFGKVYRGLWRGTEVAVKTQVLPSSTSRAARREQMAIMEVLISASLCHPNIVQMYTYSIQPLRDSSGQAGLEFAPVNDGLRAVVKAGHMSSTPFRCPVDSSSLESASTSTATGDTGTGSLHGLEISLVLELCEGGSLRDNLNRGIFINQDQRLNYAAVLDAAVDTCQAMVHLHRENVLHSDLKSQNVLLKRSNDPNKQLVAKVGDFGLSVRMNSNDSHLSCMFQGTLTHMAPEVMLSGRLSKAADVYSFGIVMFEAYTGEQPFAGVPRALLGHQVTVQGKRPVFPSDAPVSFTSLVEQCWSGTPDSRPSFEQVLVTLQGLRAALGGPTPPLRPVLGLHSSALEQSSRALNSRPAGGSKGGGESSGPAGPDAQLHMLSVKPPQQRAAQAPPCTADSGQSFVPSEDSLVYESGEIIMAETMG